MRPLFVVLDPPCIETGLELGGEFQSRSQMHSSFIVRMSRRLPRCPLGVLPVRAYGRDPNACTAPRSLRPCTADRDPFSPRPSGTSEGLPNVLNNAAPQRTRSPGTLEIS